MKELESFEVTLDRHSLHLESMQYFQILTGLEWVNACVHLFNTSCILLWFFDDVYNLIFLTGIYTS